MRARQDVRRHRERRRSGFASASSPCFTAAPVRIRRTWTLKSLLLTSAAGVFLAPEIGLAEVASTTLPTGGQVAAGNVTINQSGASMNINQTTSGGIINWQSFSIGSQASVNVAMPSGGRQLERVVGNSPSEIMGKLTSNGEVFIVNPSGITIGGGAQVDVGGLVASTMNIKDADFLSGNFTFTRDGSTGSILNQGTITAAPGGYVGLLAPEVRNQGVVMARMGTVVLAAGEKVVLDFVGNGKVNVQVDPATIKTLIENHNLISAPDGRVIMSAKAADALLGGVINNTSIIEADSLTSDGGVVRLEASNAISSSGAISANAGTAGNGGNIALISDGTTSVSGTLSARGGSDGGNGGFVETSGHTVQIARAAIDTTAPKGQTGSWLLDPYDLTVTSGSSTITPSGGTYTSGAGGSTVSNTDINNALATTNVTLQTGGTAGDGAGNGDINVNAPIAWTSGNALTMNAFRDININADVTHSGSGGSLSLNPNTGGAGGNFNVTSGFRVTLNGDAALSIGGTPYTLITSPFALQSINSNLSGHYALANDIDMSGFTFTPLGSFANFSPFTGVFDGLGHPIANLTINQPSGKEVGLFGNTSQSAFLNNVHLDNVSITGLQHVGGLVGLNFGTVANSEVQGTVTGGSGTSAQGIGGLIGMSGNLTISGRVGGPIRNSYANVSVSAGSGALGVGGLIGMNYSDVSNAFALGSVTVGSSSTSVGGLFGLSDGAVGNLPTVNHSFANTVVTAGSGSIDVGGFAGEGMAKITDSYARGTITVGDNAINVGGMVGRNIGSIDGGAGIVSLTVGKGASGVGGLTGESIGAISNSYSVSAVNAGDGSTAVGGLAGRSNTGGPSFGTTISNSYSLSTVSTGSGTSKVGGLVGENQGLISASYSAIGSVSTGSGAFRVGGLVGSSTSSGIIDHSRSFIPVTVGTGSGFVGGLVGDNAGIIRNDSYARMTLTTLGYAGQVGGLVGLNESSGTITDASAIVPINIGPPSITPSVRNNSGQIGGLVGENDGQINNSYAVTQIQIPDGTAYVGGLAGLNLGGHITGSYALGTISSGGYSEQIGGLVGWNTGFLGNTPPGTISSSYDQMTVTGSSNVGGLVGRNDGLVTASHTVGGQVIASGGINADGGVGGLIGRNSGNVVDSYNTAVVQAGAGYLNVGGLVGNNAQPGAITNSYSTASVSAGSGSTRIGGLVGANQNGAISNSYVNAPSGASVTAGAGSQFIGGFVGATGAGSVISGSYAVIAVQAGSGSSSVGGFAGGNGGEIRQSWASAPVTAGDNSTSIGGLVGRNDYIVTGSAAFGSVVAGNGAQYVGGLIGQNFNQVTDNNAFGNVTAGSNSNAVGSLIGLEHTSAGTVTNSFGNGTVSAGPGSTNVGGQIGETAP